jgi:pimeloyl-ACP methyl ester carboxylesterase
MKRRKQFKNWRNPVMFRQAILSVAATLVLTTSVFAEVSPFPAGFETKDILTNGTVIHVRIGGHGPIVVMLHGFGDTGDMWGPLATIIQKNHMVIVPDLRGMGLSAHPDSGYDKANEGRDVAGILHALHVGQVELVTHDLGNMVGYAFAAENPGRVTRWVAMDAPLPGLGHWEDQLKDPKAWHFNFYGRDEERLVSGRERIYLDRFWDELSANPTAIDEQTREHYAALYGLPHAMHDAFAQFAAFPRDAKDNQHFVAKGKLAMPVLAIGGASSYGGHLATELGYAASDVRGVSIPNSGHWLMEEQPAATIAVITNFIDPPR